MSEERRPPEDHGWRGLASGGWAAGPVGLIVPEARAGWMQSRRRSWVAVAAANRKGRNRPAGWRELARLVASLACTRVTSARARIARCGLKAQLRVVGYVRCRCFAVVSLRRSLCAAEKRRSEPGAMQMESGFRHLSALAKKKRTFDPNLAARAGTAVGTQAHGRCRPSRQRAPHLGE